MHLGSNGNNAAVRLPRRLNGRKAGNVVERAPPQNLNQWSQPTTRRASTLSRGSLIKHVCGYGICTVILSVVSFCWSFCSVLCLFWLIQWTHVPPKSQSFPVPLDFEPFRLVRSPAGPTTNAIYTLRSAPSVLNAPHPGGELTHSTTDDEDFMFEWASNAAPSAVVGFADLELNVSGILNYSEEDSFGSRRSRRSNLLMSMVSTPWNIAAKIAGLDNKRLLEVSSKFYSVRDFPIRIALGFESPVSNEDGSPAYSQNGQSNGWNTWFRQRPSDIVNIRVTFYSGNGEPVLETTTAYFPESKGSVFQEAARSTALSLLQFVCVMLPVELQSSLLAVPDQWKYRKLTLFHRFAFTAADRRSPMSQRLGSIRFAKVKFTPKIPLKNCILVFETLPTGLIALLQDYPRVLPLSLATAVSTAVAVFVGLCLGTVSLLYLVHRFLLSPSRRT